MANKHESLMKLLHVIHRLAHFDESDCTYEQSQDELFIMKLFIQYLLQNPYASLSELLILLENDIVINNMTESEKEIIDQNFEECQYKLIEIKKLLIKEIK